MVSANALLIALAAGVAVDIWRGSGWTGWSLGLLWRLSVRFSRWVSRCCREPPQTFGAARWLRVKEAAQLGLLGAMVSLVSWLGAECAEISHV